MNQVILQGNVGKDPELRIGQTGTAVLNFSVATSERYTDKQGEKQERTDWHNVVVFGRQAEVLSKIVAKGAPVLIQGRIQTDTYEKDGEKKYSTKVNAHRVDVFGKREKRETEESSQPAGGDEEVPF